jgi:hypothetical protein
MPGPVPVRDTHRHDDNLAVNGVGVAIGVQRHDASCDLLSGRIVGGRADIAFAGIEASFLSLVGLPGTEIYEGRQNHPIALSGDISGGTCLPEA